MRTTFHPAISYLIEIPKLHRYTPPSCNNYPLHAIIVVKGGKCSSDRILARCHFILIA